MKIIITGSSGFVGTHLVQKLSSKNEIVAYDIKTGQDIFNKDLLDKKMKGVDVVIHLAAYISAMESWEKPEEYLRNNSLGTLRVVQSAVKSGVSKMIFFSSAAVKAEPRTPYAVSKIAAEQILSLYKNKINTVIVRPENIYGIGQKQSYGYVIHNFIESIKNGKKIEIYGTGKQTRDFIHIDDVVNTIERILNLSIPSGKVIELGLGKAVTIVSLAKTVMNVIGIKTEILYKLERQEPKESFANTKSLIALKIDPGEFIQLKSGIEKLII